MSSKQVSFNTAEIEAAQTMAGKKSNIPENETDTQKLVRLTNTRVGKLINGIRGLANLGNLKPNTSQTDKVFNALKAELTLALTAWQQQKAMKETGFKL